MSIFNRSTIMSLKTKLNSGLNIATTEEATKQWYVMPLLVALGYDPYSSDILPEFTLDVGVKSGEKIDYALQINNQPVAIIECKKAGQSLSDKHISQLYRYFTVSNVRIAILTNGDDYWFFTDSEKANVMDLKPYYKFRLSCSTEEDIDKLEIYSRDMIQYAEISQLVQYERFYNACKELIHGLKNNTIPSWLLDVLAARSGLVGFDKSILAEYVHDEVRKTFGLEDIKAVEKQEKQRDVPSLTMGEKMRASREESKKNKSDIKLNHWYVFNDYSDGNWKHHKLDKAIILGREFEKVSGRELLVNTVKEMFRAGKINRDAILQEDQFSGAYKINAEDRGERGMTYISDYDVYVQTSYSINDIVKFIQRLCDYAHVEYKEIKIMFRE